MTPTEALRRLNAFDIILASKSPRRQHLLTELGISFRVVNHIDMDEVYPDSLTAEAIPVYLARAKAACYKDFLEPHTLLITADTIVWLDGRVIGKPSGREEAVEMLSRLSGRTHEVFTGVCIRSLHQERVFHSASKVFFHSLTPEEITYYVDGYKPFDKAGAYGVQEWIGYVGVERIEGSYYNVMGLPVMQLYHELLKMI